ncbi:hypothetical protein HOY82DRAFT_560914 [Tuber indicum]|nr:hypothetical protein HOY82DRAFT_560914 [Tuber indicum]
MMLEFGSSSGSSSSSNGDYSYGTVGVIAACLLVVKEEDWYHRRGSGRRYKYDMHQTDANTKHKSGPRSTPTPPTITTTTAVRDRYRYQRSPGTHHIHSLLRPPPSVVICNKRFTYCSFFFSLLLFSHIAVFTGVPFGSF